MPIFLNGMRLWTAALVMISFSDLQAGTSAERMFANSPEYLKLKSEWSQADRAATRQQLIVDKLRAVEETKREAMLDLESQLLNLMFGPIDRGALSDMVPVGARMVGETSGLSRDKYLVEIQSVDQEPGSSIVTLKGTATRLWDARSGHVSQIEKRIDLRKYRWRWNETISRPVIDQRTRTSSDFRTWSSGHAALAQSIALLQPDEAPFDQKWLQLRESLLLKPFSREESQRAVALFKEALEGLKQDRGAANASRSWKLESYWDQNLSGFDALVLRFRSKEGNSFCTSWVNKSRLQGVIGKNLHESSIQSLPLLLKDSKGAVKVVNTTSFTGFSNSLPTQRYGLSSFEIECRLMGAELAGGNGNSPWDYQDNSRKERFLLLLDN